MRVPLAPARRRVPAAAALCVLAAAGTGLLGTARACERNCRDAVLSSILDLFVPRVHRAYHVFEMTLYMNLPRDIARALEPRVGPLVRRARRNATSWSNVRDPWSIRGVFSAVIPVADVPGFRGDSCCRPYCPRITCCSDPGWPRVINEFTAGLVVCGSEYSVAAHLDDVFYYVQTIMQARSLFANANSRGSQELTAQVTRAVGPRNRWLARFFGNLKVAIENLNKAYSFLKENLEHTYAPLSAYLICVDHRLDRPASHPHAQLENCTRPAFEKTPVVRSRGGYDFPPANYHLVYVPPPGK